MKGNAKGLLFGHLETYAKSRSGADAWSRVVASLDKEDRAVLSGFVLALGWYPVGTWNRALDAYLRANYNDPRKAMDDFAAYLGEQELRGIVKFVLKLGSPEFMLDRTDFLWSRYFDRGTFAAKPIEPRHYHLTLDGPTDPDVAPSRFNCAHGVTAWLTRGLQLAGCEHGRVEQTRCRFDGAPRCEFRAKW